MRIHLIALVFCLTYLDFFISTSYAQTSAGAYTIMYLGTAGSHRNDPGGKGTMTIGNDGRISGTLFNYSDNTRDRFSGSVNLATGQGTVRETGKSSRYNLSFSTSTRTFFEVSVRKIGSSSRGLLWGYR